MNLLDMTPRGYLSSTGYALANPGREYVILQPDVSDPFTVVLESGVYLTEWFSIHVRETIAGQPTTVEGVTGRSFRAPPAASGPTVLHLTLRARDAR